MKRDNCKHDIIEALQALIKGNHILADEPLAHHTTFKIGGPADFLVMPESLDEVQAALQVARQFALPVTVIGNGSNMLVLDGGIRGLVLKFGTNMHYIRQEGSRLIAGAGVLLKDVSQFAAKVGLGGMEFAVGIPGSIGGAVFMNAGAYNGEMSQVVAGVTVACAQNGVKYFDANRLEFGYRHSVFHDNRCVICEVELQLVPGQQHDIDGKIQDYTERRECRQPLEMASAGSTFKRPEGYFAGTLIEAAGLKGLSVGGAQVSVKHAGFIVNTGGATANDVLQLIAEVQKRVYEHAGVKLQPEVRILGEA